MLFTCNAEWTDLPGVKKGTTFWPCFVTDWNRMRGGKPALKAHSMLDRSEVYVMHSELASENYGRLTVVTHAVRHVPPSNSWRNAD